MSRAKESDELVFFVNGKKVIERNADPEVNLLFYLRKVIRLTGTKYGCGGGGCGACTVMVSRYDPVFKKISHFSIAACLVPICSLHGAAVTTVEGIGSTKTRIHPVQSSSCCRMNGNGKCCLDEEENEPAKKTSIYTKLYEKEEFQPLDPTQELIFPPELMRMAEDPQKRALTFCGERTTWIAPGTLKDLLDLKMKYPSAPLMMGNTSLGLDMKFKEVSYPIIISPARVLELHIVTNTKEGLTLGAGLSLTQVKDVLEDVVSRLPEERTQKYRALLKHLKTLAGQQIRNMASLGGHIISRLPTSDLNPILGVGNCILNVASTDSTSYS
ncbi:aldehyde oxidase 3-like isoform X4 [Peromyscus maniculatus bairdii]|uniref:aldehyde oxidase 3-like isoform X4 n=1 Tax=Peromyscus maniculatus bairdii TaxID=230844 RepID=UPI003FD56F0A